MKDPNPVRYSKVTRRVWTDANFRQLSSAPPNGQTLWFRLLTGTELSNIPGLFAAWEGGLADALQWPLEGFRDAFKEVSAKGMAEADWKAGLVWVPNAITHNEPTSIHVVTSWRTIWAELPECELKIKAHARLRAYLKTMGESWVRAFDSACPLPGAKPSPKPSAKPSPIQEQEQEQEQEIQTPHSPPEGGGSVGESELELEPEEPAPPPQRPLALADPNPPTRRLPDEREDEKRYRWAVLRVWDAWKHETGHHRAVLDRKRARRIIARLREGLSEAELIAAIQNRRNNPHLMGQNDTGQVYDGIETLLRDRAMVEKLCALTERPRPPRRGPQPVQANTGDYDPFAKHADFSP